MEAKRAIARGSSNACEGGRSVLHGQKTISREIRQEWESEGEPQAGTYSRWTRMQRQDENAGENSKIGYGNSPDEDKKGRVLKARESGGVRIKADQSVEMRQQAVV